MNHDIGRPKAIAYSIGLHAGQAIMANAYCAPVAVAVATRTWAVRLGRQSKRTAYILRMRMLLFFGYVSCIFNIVYLRYGIR